MRGLLGRLQDDVVLGAEGYLFELERRGYLKSGPYVPEVVLDFPDAVRELHREFLRAGAEVMVAFTYYGHREKLRMVGREDDLEPLNRQALRLAKEIPAAVDCHVAAQTVPYRTTPDQPTFQSLRDTDGSRVFPIALDPFVCTRFELADFARTARDAGIGYLGVCCGGAPHHVRAMAES